MNVEKIFAWIFFISALLALWALIFAALKLVRVLREIRLSLLANRLTLDVTRTRAETAVRTLGEIKGAAEELKQTAQDMNKASPSGAQ